MSTEIKQCSVPSCTSRLLAKGYCGKHYQKNSTYGNPLASAPAQDIGERFWSKVDKSGKCWLWTASCYSTGYGQFSVGGRSGTPKPAHRVTYQMIKGRIPNGMQIDHMCHNTKCVNPAHLRAVTPKQNMENLRGAHADSTSGIMGVYLNKNGSYRVAAYSDGRLHRRGPFLSIEDAETAAIELRNEIFTHNHLDRTH